MTWIVDASYTISIITFVYFETSNNILGNRSKWLTTIVINGARCHSSSITKKKKKNFTTTQHTRPNRSRREKSKEHTMREKNVHVEIVSPFIKKNKIKRIKGTHSFNFDPESGFILTISYFHKWLDCRSNAAHIAAIFTIICYEHTPKKRKTVHQHTYGDRDRNWKKPKNVD